MRQDHSSYLYFLSCWLRLRMLRLLSGFRLQEFQISKNLNPSVTKVTVTRSLTPYVHAHNSFFCLEIDFSDHANLIALGFQALRQRLWPFGILHIVALTPIEIARHDLFIGHPFAVVRIAFLVKPLLHIIQIGALSVRCCRYWLWNGESSSAKAIPLDRALDSPIEHALQRFRLLETRFFRLVLTAQKAIWKLNDTYTGP